jgi:hypothetical protein
VTVNRAPSSVRRTCSKRPVSRELRSSVRAKACSRQRRFHGSWRVKL